ncbi:RhoGAP domain-containing protein [Candidatus Berkiella aquae]|uniref:RhoGAP domain protein n=1 Tax=Candidatus Berkiella aquae TaxID=295108 RepID=A0A0Q9YXU0_9GAMM|nr:RhoGAP domain-containing protein [Candidatus Berkiella aquae]MCS5710534.1 hypothetical protein [Candidatus Berkiella aquae]
MAAEGPIQQTLRVFESINAHFLAHPELLNTDGIFRISSGGRTHIDLVENIQNHKKIDWTQYSAYDLANALKYTLLQVKLLPATDVRVKSLVEKLESGNSQGAFLDFINSLDTNNNDREIAQILNIALDISRRTAIQQKYNRMTPLNLAVVWGPAIQDSLSMEPAGKDLHANVFFTMNLVNPAVEEAIEAGLAKVVPEVLELRQRTLADAEAAYQGATAMLKIAAPKMEALRMQEMELQKALAVHESMLEKGKLSRAEKKKLKNEIIPEYKKAIETLQKQLDNWKVEAKRHLKIMTGFEELFKLITGSCDRLVGMLGDRSADEALMNAAPVFTVQFDQQDAEQTHEQEEQAKMQEPASAERARL